MQEFPKIISVDDHVVEPPNVWQDRLPAKYRDDRPARRTRPGRRDDLQRRQVHRRRRRDRAPARTSTGGSTRTCAARSCGSTPPSATRATRSTCARSRYDDMRHGRLSVPERLDDMDTNWIESALCFPTFPRFCGQTFTEAKDKELALLCVQAYNDWMVEEWCGPSGRPAHPAHASSRCGTPSWPPRRCAATPPAASTRCASARSRRSSGCRRSTTGTTTGSRSSRRATRPAPRSTCTSARRSKMPSTSTDAPPAVGSTLTFANSCFSLVDWLMRGVFTPLPGAKIAYSEGSIGWIPYVLERADVVWEENRGWGGVGRQGASRRASCSGGTSTAASSTTRTACATSSDIGVDNVTYESDYPHSDSTWPNTREIAEEQMKHLDRRVVEKIVRGNAIKMLNLTPEGRWAGRLTARWPRLPDQGRAGRRRHGRARRRRATSAYADGRDRRASAELDEDAADDLRRHRAGRHARLRRPPHPLRRAALLGPVRHAVQRARRHDGHRRQLRLHARAAQGGGRRLHRRMMGKVEGMPLAALENGVPWTWETFGEYLDALDGRARRQRRVPRRPLRAAPLRDGRGRDRRRGAPTSSSRRWSRCCTSRSSAGGLGFSTTLSATHSDGDGKPVASRHATRGGAARAVRRGRRARGHHPRGHRRRAASTRSATTRSSCWRRCRRRPAAPSTGTC